MKTECAASPASSSRSHPQPQPKENTISDASLTGSAPSVEPLPVAPLVENAEGAWVTPPQAAVVAAQINEIATGVAAVKGGSPVVATIAADVASASADVASGKGISDFAASLIRTVTPTLVGAGLAALGTIGLHVSGAYEPVIDAGATFVLGGAYYTIVRAIEVKYPKIGWLLGVPRKPVYSL